MHIEKSIIDSDGIRQILVRGFEGKNIKLNTIAKKYSRKYYLPWSLPTNFAKQGLRLKQRKKPLAKAHTTWKAWELK